MGSTNLPGMSPEATPEPSADVARPTSAGPRRRSLLTAGGGLWLTSLLPAARPARAQTPGTPATPRFAAAWDDADGMHNVGVLAAREGTGRLEVQARIELPSRAHGLAWEPGGTLLATARRPGDWLLRWSPDAGSTRAAPGAKPQWRWSEPDRRFTGHTLRDPSGQRLYSVETDLESGQGLVVARDPATLDVQAEWPTHGIDPHQLIWGADGHLLVANGGVPSMPETGRLKRGLERMDPSLVRLDRASGKLLGQWRLADPRLSIRHLAMDSAGRVGIALQAEHDDAALKAASPVLAIFDGQGLSLAAAPQALAGYGGDVAATAEGFVVSVPRAGGVARWSASGQWRGLETLAEACALASPAAGAAGGAWWAGGLSEARCHGPAGVVTGYPLPPLRLDNHWVIWSA